MEIHFGKNIKVLRNSKGLTQGELGDLFGVKSSTVGGWETQNSFPEFKVLAALREYFKEKRLDDITGLSLYSWKDTGMTEFAKILRPVELRDHARHASIDQSLAYYHAEKVNLNVKGAKIRVETD